MRVQCSGRLHVSLTKVYDGKNMVINKFDTREELIEVSIIIIIIIRLDNIIMTYEVILASCFIPLFSGTVPPRYRGTRVIGR